MQKTSPSAYIRGFAKHGVVFKGRVEGSEQQYGDCPFCGGENKFYVNENNGLWDCKSKECSGRSGDYYGFFAQISNANFQAFSGRVANNLARDRGIHVSSLRRFGVGYNGQEYTIPVYGPRNTRGVSPVTDVQFYVPGKKAISSPGSKGGILSAREPTGSNVVWLAEGIWDVACWDGILREMGINEDVYGIAGARSFPKDIVPLFQGKEVRILLDNDEAGAKGTSRIWGMLDAVARKLYWLNWSEDTPDKFDIRDLFLKFEKNSEKTYQRVQELLDVRAPRGAAEATGTANANTIPEDAMTGQGIDRALVEKEYRKWLHIEDPYVLDVMFGSLFANRIDSDPFWLFLVAPPSGSKSELLMTLSDAPNIYTITSITPHALISGSFGAGSDPSLIPEIIGKTLVVKDFTTILTMPQAARDEIFGILRDAYDGKIEKKFGNSVHRRYTGHFGIVAGVTGVIEMHTQTSLGERFLKYRIKRIGNIDTGREIIMRAMRNIGKEKDMRSELRVVAANVMNRPIGPECMPEVSDYIYEQTTMLAQWVAALRGQVVRDRYNQQVSYLPEQETGARLGKQLMTFGLGTAIFRGEKVMSDTTLGLVREVARCTAPDKIERIVEKFYLNFGDDYADTKEISAVTRLPAETCRAAMENLEILNILDREPSDKLTRHRWRLSDIVYSMTHRLGMYIREKRTRRKDR